MRLYVCDDNPSHRALVRAVLTQEADMRVVGDGWRPAESAEAVERLQPDVVLLDVAMPGHDGFAALPLMRAAAPDAAIVMLSTAWTAENERRALDLGASAYVHKPFNVFDLPALIRGAAGEARALVCHFVRRCLAGEPDRALAAVHHDVELEPLFIPGPIHGREDLRRLCVQRPPGVSVTPLELEGEGPSLVLLAEAEVTGERLAPAWTVTVEHGKVARITGYRSWDDARAAAGV